MHINFAELGDKIAESWGRTDHEKVGDCLKSMFVDKDYNRINVSLMAAMVTEIKELRREIAALPDRMVRASFREERALEKEKQKTAKAQQKAAEATPPTVTVIQMRPEEIAAAVNNGRVLRRF